MPRRPIVIHSSLNKALCFEPVPQIHSPVWNNYIVPDDWKLELAILMRLYTQSMSVAEIIQAIDNKTNPPNNQLSKKVIETLQKIYAVLSGLIIDKNINFNPNDKDACYALVNKLNEGLATGVCPEGFTIRVLDTWRLLDLRVDLAGRLQKIREALVQDAAREITDKFGVPPNLEVHGRNYVISVAKANGLGVRTVYDDDPWTGGLDREEVVLHLRDIFEARYNSPCLMMSALEEQLISQLAGWGYRGFLPDGYTNGEYDAFVSHLKKIFPDRTEAAWLNWGADEWDELTIMTDLNWPLIRQLIFQQLVAENYLVGIHDLAEIPFDSHNLHELSYWANRVAKPEEVKAIIANASWDCLYCLFLGLKSESPEIHMLQDRIAAKIQGEDFDNYWSSLLSLPFSSKLFQWQIRLAHDFPIHEGRLHYFSQILTPLLKNRLTEILSSLEHCSLSRLEEIHGVLFTKKIGGKSIWDLAMDRGAPSTLELVQYAKKHRITMPETKIIESFMLDGRILCFEPRSNNLERHQNNLEESARLELMRELLPIDEIPYSTLLQICLRQGHQSGQMNQISFLQVLLAQIRQLGADRRLEIYREYAELLLVAAQYNPAAVLILAEEIANLKKESVGQRDIQVEVNLASQVLALLYQHHSQDVDQYLNYLSFLDAEIIRQLFNDNPWIWDRLLENSSARSVIKILQFAEEIPAPKIKDLLSIKTQLTQKNALMYAILEDKTEVVAKILCLMEKLSSEERAEIFLTLSEGGENSLFFSLKSEEAIVPLLLQSISALTIPVQILILSQTIEKAGLETPKARLLAHIQSIGEKDIDITPLLRLFRLNNLNLDEAKFLLSLRKKHSAAYSYSRKEQRCIEEFFAHEQGLALIEEKLLPLNLMKYHKERVLETILNVSDVARKKVLLDIALKKGNPVGDFFGAIRGLLKTHSCTGMYAEIRRLKDLPPQQMLAQFKQRRGQENFWKKPAVIVLGVIFLGLLLLVGAIASIATPICWPLVAIAFGLVGLAAIRLLAIPALIMGVKRLRVDQSIPDGVISGVENETITLLGGVISREVHGLTSSNSMPINSSFSPRVVIKNPSHSEERLLGNLKTTQAPQEGHGNFLLGEHPYGFLTARRTGVIPSVAAFDPDLFRSAPKP